MVRNASARALLRALSRDAALSDPPATLLATLQAYLDARAADVKAGTLLTATAGLGYSSQYAQAAGFSPTDALELANTFLETYETSLASLVAGGIPSPTDAQILADMLTAFPTVTRYWLDMQSCRTQ